MTGSRRYADVVLSLAHQSLGSTRLPNPNLMSSHNLSRRRRVPASQRATRKYHLEKSLLKGQIRRQMAQSAPSFSQ